MSKLSVQVGLRIRAIRERFGIIPENLAESLTPPIGLPHLLRYENGETLPNPDRLVQIAKLLSVTVRWLMDGVDPVIGDIDDGWLAWIKSTEAIQVIERSSDIVVDLNHIKLSAELLMGRYPKVEDYRDCSRVLIRNRYPSQNNVFSLMDRIIPKSTKQWPPVE